MCLTARLLCVALLWLPEFFPNGPFFPFSPIPHPPPHGKGPPFHILHVVISLSPSNWSSTVHLCQDLL